MGTLLTLALVVIGGCGTDGAGDEQTGVNPSQSTAEPVGSDVEKCAQIDFGPMDTLLNEGVARLTIEPVELLLVDGVYELVVTFAANSDGEADTPIAVSWIIEGVDGTGSPVSAIPAAADASGPTPQSKRTGPVEVEGLRAIGANARFAVDGDKLGAVLYPTQVEVFSTTGC